MGKRPRTDSASSSSDVEMTSPDATSTPDDSSLAISDNLEPPVKYPHVNHTETAEIEIVMKCHLPPHEPLIFSSYQDYDVHYQQDHVNRCSDCYRNFPSEHYLHLHIAENHDPINHVRKERGERTYACFVEDCTRVCSTAQKRRQHVIDKHGFPKFYDFYIVNYGIDKRTSMLRPKARSRASSKSETLSQQSEGGVVEEAKPRKDKAVSALTKSMSTLQFRPRNLKFGRGQRSGFIR